MALQHYQQSHQRAHPPFRFRVIAHPPFLKTTCSPAFRNTIRFLFSSIPMPWHTSTSSTTLYKLSNLTSSFPLCFTDSLPLPRQLNFPTTPLQKENNMPTNGETQVLSLSSFPSSMLVKLGKVSSTCDLLFLIQLFSLSLSLTIYTIELSPLSPTNKYARTS